VCAGRHGARTEMEPPSSPYVRGPYRTALPRSVRVQVHYIYACIIMHVIGSPQGRGQISRACAESAARGQMSTCMHYGLSVPQHMHRSIHGWSSLSLLVLSTAGCEEPSFAPPHCQPTDGRPCCLPAALTILALSCVFVVLRVLLPAGTTREPARVHSSLVKNEFINLVFNLNWSVRQF
jgi:hypothetical protein